MYFTSCSLVPRLPASQRAWIVHLANVLLGKIVHADKQMVSDAPTAGVSNSTQITCAPNTHSQSDVIKADVCG